MYREEWNFLPYSAYSILWMNPGQERIGMGCYSLRMSVAIELEEKFGLDATIAYTPAPPTPPNLDGGGPGTTARPSHGIPGLIRTRVL